MASHRLLINRIQNVNHVLDVYHHELGRTGFVARSSTRRRAGAFCRRQEAPAWRPTVRAAGDHVREFSGCLRWAPHTPNRPWRTGRVAKDSAWPPAALGRATESVVGRYRFFVARSNVAGDHVREFSECLEWAPCTPSGPWRTGRVAKDSTWPPATLGRATGFFPRSGRLSALTYKA